MNLLEPQDLLTSSVLEIRGDGKAGGGLVLAFQSLAALLLSDPGIHVQEWPFFSSARRGANIRSFMRVSRRPIAKACEVTHPALSLLMNESAARSVDFTAGVPRGGTFVINTPRTPAECARHFRLAGRVVTVAGDEIGVRYLKHAIGNVSAYVAMAQLIGGLAHDDVTRSFLQLLEKRRIPRAVVERNRAALEASFGAIRSGVFDEREADDRQTEARDAPLELPVGAQSALRLSAENRTADYARSGFRLRFADPGEACTGCAHCITNCPEGIIRFAPDRERGLRVTGVDVSSYCKLCGECIAVCPEKLFTEEPYQEVWEEASLTS